MKKLLILIAVSFIFAANGLAMGMGEHLRPEKNKATSCTLSRQADNIETAKEAKKTPATPVKNKIINVTTV